MTSLATLPSFASTLQELSGTQIIPGTRSDDGRGCTSFVAVDVAGVYHQIIVEIDPNRKGLLSLTMDELPGYPLVPIPDTDAIRLRHESGVIALSGRPAGTTGQWAAAIIEWLNTNPSHAISVWQAKRLIRNLYGDGRDDVTNTYHFHRSFNSAWKIVSRQPGVSSSIAERDEATKKAE